ncbi:MAG: hypothetical protein HY520_00185 [Candidatus Aenigmarchaeota archaeon]|nr:hypothetical protein [Candidatus Aenigmarchaeota archaeon]
MPPWLPPTLWAAALWSVHYLVLTIFIKKRLAGFAPGALLPAHTFLLWTVTQIPAGMLLLHGPAPDQLPLLLLMGALHACTFYPFLSAFAYADPIQLAGLAQLAAVSAMGWSALLLHRFPTLPQGAAMAVLILGTLLITDKPFSPSDKALQRMLLYAVSCGAYFTLGNAFQGKLAAQEVYAWSRLGVLAILPGFFLLRPAREAAASLRRVRLLPLLIVLALQAVVVVATLLSYEAIVRSPHVAVMGATLGSVGQLLTIAGVLLLAQLIPGYGAGRTAHLPRKAGAALLICAGLWLAAL